MLAQAEAMMGILVQREVATATLDHGAAALEQIVTTASHLFKAAVDRGGQGMERMG